MTTIAAPKMEMTVAAHAGHTTQAPQTAVTSKIASMTIRTGPGVAIPVTCLSPGVLNVAGSPTSRNKAGSAVQADPVASTAAHGPITHAASSIAKRKPDDAGVSYGLGPGAEEGRRSRFMSSQASRWPVPLKGKRRGEPAPPAATRALGG